MKGKGKNRKLKYHHYSNSLGKPVKCPKLKKQGRKGQQTEFQKVPHPYQRQREKVKNIKADDGDDLCACPRSLRRGRMTRERAVIRGLLLPEGPGGPGPVQDSRLPGVILHRGMIPTLIPGSSAGVQGRCLPVVACSRKTKLLPDSRLHQQMPCDPPLPQPQYHP